MSVTRDALYAEVWAEPMLVVAKRYNVSANYLGRVCSHLNVPSPPRGYWAKVKVGMSPAIAVLPAARPGEVTVWTRGDGLVGGTVGRRRSASRTGAGDSARRGSDLPTHHELVCGVSEFFEAGRVSEVGYLRPRKRNVVDLFVSREALPAALNLGNSLFNLLERGGHRVTLAPGAQLFSRPELPVYPGQKFDYHNRQEWVPYRQTIVFIEAVAFGLTIYEQTEHVDVTYEWNRPIRYARVDPKAKAQKQRWQTYDRTQKKHMPSGLLAVRAYSPYRRVEWQQTWREAQPGGLVRQLAPIVKALRVAVPDIVARRAEAAKQAQQERMEWEVQSRELARREQERRLLEAQKESRRLLLAAIDRWAFARNLESFFEDVIRRASELEPEECTRMVQRVDKARELLGGTDALAPFREWKAPEEL
jgi:hypothetical protein